MSDPLLDQIASLPGAVARPAHAQRTRDRCHRLLARRACAPRSGRLPLRDLWPRALMGLGALYIAEAIRHLLRVYSTR